MEVQKRPSTKRKRTRTTKDVVTTTEHQRSITAGPQNSENDQGGKLLNFLIFMRGVLQRRELNATFTISR